MLQIINMYKNSTIQISNKNSVQLLAPFLFAYVLLSLQHKFAYICNEKHLLKGVVIKVLLKPNPKKR